MPRLPVARFELRLLRAEIAAFCQERARLIVQEPLDDGGERWVYRGDVSKAPIEWSIRAGRGRVQPAVSPRPPCLATGEG